MADRDRSGENGPDADARLVPPPRVRPIQPIPHKGYDKPPKKPRSWLTAALLVVLLALVVFTFVGVPRFARPPSPAGEIPPADPSPAAAPAPPPVLPEPGGSGRSPEELRQAAYRKDRAEEARVAALSLAEALASRDVGIWAGEDHAEATRLIATGDRRMAELHFAEADSDYRAALARLQDIDTRSTGILRELLAEGRNALASGDSVAAAAAFRLAARIAPDNAIAASGLRRAAVLDDLLEHLRAGRRAEQDGDAPTAEQRYKRAVALDPMSREAQDALARVQGRLRENAFAAIMSEALSALDAGDWSVARDALGRGERMRPGSPQVAEALAQVDEAQKLESIAAHRTRAADAEGREDWTAAVAEYEAVLKIDAALRFARTGVDRARARADLSARIDYHLSNPDRLSTDAVLAEVIELLDEARSVNPAGPRHAKQVGELDQLVAQVTPPVRVVLESDEKTEVTVYQVGVLGKFERMELELRPGTYTVLGTRRGYRDVRRTLVVRPGQEPAPLLVLCEEKV